MPISGDLQELSLADLVQLSCQTGKRAHLVVKRAGATGEVYFDQGEIVHAQLGDLQGDDAFFTVIGWQEATFHLQAGAVAPVRTITTPWSALLLTAIQRIDESAWDQS